MAMLHHSKLSSYPGFSIMDQSSWIESYQKRLNMSRPVKLDGYPGFAEWDALCYEEYVGRYKGAHDFSRRASISGKTILLSISNLKHYFAFR